MKRKGCTPSSKNLIGIFPPILRALSWDAVQGILHRMAQREGLLNPPAVVRWLALDEIALKKGCKQDALVISAPPQGRVLGMLPERAKETLAT